MRTYITVVLFFLAAHLDAWWDVGHMTVAQIAYEHLEPEVKSQVEVYIAAFTAFAPESDTFVTAGAWADDIKNEGLTAFYSWHGSAKPYDPEGVLSKSTYKALVAKLDSNDIVYAIDECLKTMQNPKSSLFSKALMLRFLIHLVADAHQPLHCISLYNKQFPSGDIAGTHFPITGKSYAKTLHSYWDSMLGLGTEKFDRPLSDKAREHIEELSHTIQNSYPKNSFPHYEDADAKDWCKESFDLAVAYVYKGILPNKTPSDSYETEGRKIASSQIALAGYRLAHLLNTLKRLQQKEEYIK